MPYRPIDLFDYAKDNRPSIVYMATNSVNGKRYVGMTRSGLNRRSGQHIAAALRGKNYCMAFYRAIRKYGADAFSFCVLEECASFREAGIAEIRLIAELNPEYNASGGGESIPNIGFRPSEKTLEALRKAALGRPGYWTGKKRPDIAENQRKRLTGRADLMKHLHAAAHTPEARAKASATKRLRGLNDNQRAAMARRRKKIICLDDGRIFFGAKQVAEAIGARPDSVSRVLIGARPTIKGLRFAYVNDGGEP